MPRQAIISASTVQECAFRLIVCAGHKSPSIAGGTEDQATASSEHIGAHPSCGERKVEHQVASNLVYVGLYPGLSQTRKIFLSISVKAIIAFRRKPTVDAITVSHQESSGVCSSPRDSVAVRVSRENPGALQTNLRAVFLSRGVQR